MSKIEPDLVRKNNKLVKATNIVQMDEPCMGIYELNFKTPDERARHRYQIIVVVRNDQPIEFRRDLGPAKKWKKVQQFRIPGCVEDEAGNVYPLHTVGELIDIADYLRDTKPLIDGMELAYSPPKRELTICSYSK